MTTPSRRPPLWPRLLIALVLLAALLYVAACGYLYAVQGSMLYRVQPRALPLDQSRLVLQRPDADVVVTALEREGPKALIYFGGNAEDVSRALAGFAKTFPDRSIYLMHYRGYGGSGGAPSERAIHEDATALFDFVKARHAQVDVVGRSLGSGVAVHLASEQPVRRLVLVTPYDSIVAIAAGQFPWVPVRWLLRDHYESVRYAPRVKVPTLVIIAEKDRLIPRANTDLLVKTFQPGVADVVVIPDADHRSVIAAPEYLTSIGKALS